MRVALSENGRDFSLPEVAATPQNFEEGMRLFEFLAKKLVGDKKLIAACGGIAGPFNKEKTMLINAPHLPNWINQPLVERLGRILNCHVYLENDAALGGLGEAIRGAGQGEKIVAYITVGTGVGGARIVDGKIDVSAFGFEPGHQIIQSDGGRWEDFVSGSGWQKRYQQLPTETTDERLWDEGARWLAVGLHNAILFWSPNVVIFGGSMILGAKSISLAATQNHLKEINKIFPEIPPVKKALLGDLVGLQGALAFLKQKS